MLSTHYMHQNGCSTTEAGPGGYRARRKRRAQVAPLVVRAKLSAGTSPIRLPDLGYQNNQMDVPGLALAQFGPHSRDYRRYCGEQDLYLLLAKDVEQACQGLAGPVHDHLWRARLVTRTVTDKTSQAEFQNTTSLEYKKQIR